MDGRGELCIVIVMYMIINNYDRQKRMIKRETFGSEIAMQVTIPTKNNNNSTRTNMTLSNIREQ